MMWKLGEGKWYLDSYDTTLPPDQTARELVKDANLNTGLTLSKGVSSQKKTMRFFNKSNR